MSKVHPMLEKVARAMFDRSEQIAWEGGLEPKSWTGIDPSRRALELDLARAAVRALMEPDASMIDAGIRAAEEVEDYSTDTEGSYRCDTPSDMPRPVFRAMLLPLVEGEG